MKRRDFLKIFGIGLVASVATRAAQARVCERQNGLLDRLYPVGAIYISTSSVNPGTHLGGNWEPWGQGRVPLGCGAIQTNTSSAHGSLQNTINITTSNVRGGADAHILTIPQMPSHTHTGAWYHATNVPGSSSGLSRGGPASNLALTGSTGGGAAHNNLQPYITVFMWRRSA